MTTHNNTAVDYEALAKTLDAHEDYTVIRRFQTKERYNDNTTHEETKIAVFLDCETTGLDFDNDTIIELAMVRFEYGIESGRIFRVFAPFDALHDPKRPIPKEITALTGIDDAMVAGKIIDADAVAAYIDGAALIVAHNAAFDRPMVENNWQCFAEFPWACSQYDIDWRAFGIESVKLEYLAYRFGVFYSGHRATIDCEVGIHVLAGIIEGEPVMRYLLHAARNPGYIVRAVHAPITMKDKLKMRRYRWNDGSGGGIRAWWTTVPSQALENELDWLRTHIYSPGFVLPDSVVQKTSAYTRYRHTQ